MSLIVRGAWYLKGLPNHVVAELEDGRLVMFRLGPFRDVFEAECKPYHGRDPQKYGLTLISEAWKFYGLIPAT